MNCPHCKSKYAHKWHCPESTVKPVRYCQKCGVPGTHWCVKDTEPKSNRALREFELFYDAELGEWSVLGPHEHQDKNEVIRVREVKDE